MTNEKVSMAEMIEYLAGIPNGPGSNPPSARLRRQNFFHLLFPRFPFERMDVFCIAGVFQKENFETIRKIIRRKKKKRSLYDFLKRKIKKKN